MVSTKPFYASSCHICLFKHFKQFTVWLLNKVNSCGSSKLYIYILFFFLSNISCSYHLGHHTQKLFVTLIFCEQYKIISVNSWANTLFCKIVEKCFWEFFQNPVAYWKTIMMAEFSKLIYIGTYKCIMLFFFSLTKNFFCLIHKWSIRHKWCNIVLSLCLCWLSHIYKLVALWNLFSLMVESWWNFFGIIYKSGNRINFIRLIIAIIRYRHGTYLNISKHWTVISYPVYIAAASDIFNSVFYILFKYLCIIRMEKFKHLRHVIPCP